MRWKPEDYIVAALAILIVVGMFGRLYGIVILGRELTPEGANITENVLSGIMAIISMYVGAKIQKRRDDKDE